MAAGKGAEGDICPPAPAKGGAPKGGAVFFATQNIQKFCELCWGRDGHGRTNHVRRTMHIISVSRSPKCTKFVGGWGFYALPLSISITLHNDIDNRQNALFFSSCNSNYRLIDIRTQHFRRFLALRPQPVDLAFVASWQFLFMCSFNKTIILVRKNTNIFQCFIAGFHRGCWRNCSAVMQQ